MMIEGKIKTGRKTKELVRYLNKNDIALLFHDDIDEAAALSIIKTGISTILNTGKSMTGRYDSRGTRLLYQSGISLYDIELPFQMFKDGDHIRIINTDLVLNSKQLISNCCYRINEDYINSRLELSHKNKNKELKAFIENTLEYAFFEKEMVLSGGKYPQLDTRLEDREVLVVARGNGCEQDLAALRAYIGLYRPVLIGVDGGADILINQGYTPDILIGDMDSVSDIGIYKSKEVILHAYPDGFCPCKERVDCLNIRYKLLPMTGTSEDVALLLAYDMGAKWIVLVGGHACMQDFLEKGRKGMGSTLLTRLKIGDKLIDFKGYGRISPPSNAENIYGKNIPDHLYNRFEERDLLCLKM